MKVLRQKDLKAYREKELEKYKYCITPIINPVLDHNHSTGHVRQVLDRETNQFIGKLESNFKRFIKWKFPHITLIEILQRITSYLDNYDHPSATGVLHPTHVKTLVSRFSRLTVVEQQKVLGKKYKHLKSKSERTKAYRQLLMSEENIYKLEN